MRFRTYWALVTIDLKLAGRDRAVLFFNYLFPLIFFFVFAEMLGAGQGGAISYVVSMVLVLGILGNGLFGAGMRAVQEREQNILRRFKVAPISPLPLLVASILSGWALYLPAVVMVLVLARFLYGMDFPAHLFSLMVLASVGVAAFRAMGLIIASVANSTQESNILIQLLYMPMLFLSGATFPMTMLPQWAQILAQFLPASYLVTGFQGIFLRGEALDRHLSSVAALIVTLALGTWLSAQLFRWEREEKIRPAAKLWVAAVLIPFLVIGFYQVYSRDYRHQAEILYRQMRRSQSWLIRDARIVTGDGSVIESGSVLIQKGRIVRVTEGRLDEDIEAEVIEAAGKTLLPGLIDSHVHLAPSGGLPGPILDLEGAMRRALAAYLYCGVTTVKTLMDDVGKSLALRDKVESGEVLGAELVVSTPLFTAPGGHGTEYFAHIPEELRKMIEAEFVRTPRTPEEARQQVRELARRGIQGVKAVLEAGAGATRFSRMDVDILRALIEEAHSLQLPVVVHTGKPADVRDAIEAGADGIEHGSFSDPVPRELLDQLASRGIYYDPTLTVAEALSQALEKEDTLLKRPLFQQVVNRQFWEDTRQAVISGELAEMIRDWAPADAASMLRTASQNLLDAYRAGVVLIAGTDSGNFLLFHGPALHRELELWVRAGIPPSEAIAAATWNAARLARRAGEIGAVREGLLANLLLVDGNPLERIGATQAISAVFLRGERVSRGDLLQEE